ncbi:hypothetical protein SAMN06272771_7619 [Streptomyces sp. Ag82_O1-12]|uniref:hypothetical protein n=1 Tax=unclassified Streptomyces TaxID=2593676 RepID=UPI000BCD5088|nr:MULTISPECIES: hypothetical protein [unclassified Streptomyces]SMQ21679.1 hypothetical protein SAMN06272771_7619 [Streptomyces sp. Ag82_O1-12]SOD50114.1 hypothetical protein SAMN06272727_7628 [Streptomyces sp. Ag82_G6-1]
MRGRTQISDLAFYARVATRGDVLGAGVGMQPAVWETKLGADFLDAEDGSLLRRDYGLVELSFQEEDGAWPCFGVSVQVHRLRRDTESSVPAALRQAYGAFAPSTRFADLAAAIAGLGCSLDPEPDEDGTSRDMHRYRVPESGVRIFVRAEEHAPRQAGEVWSLSVSPAWWRAAG